MSAKSPDPALLAKLPKSYLEEDISDHLFNLAVAFIVVQTVLVVLFYISRWLTKTLNGIECWLFMPIGYLANVAVCICCILAVKIGGAGFHIEAVLLNNGAVKGKQMAVTRAQLDKPVEYCNHAATTATRLVILALYMRIFSSNKYRYAAYATGGLIVLTWIASLILSSSICTPLAFQWNKSIPGGKCGNIRAYYTYISIPSILCDVIMLILPLPALYKLRMDIAAKVGLIATFLIGSVGIITACLRMARFITTAEFGKDSTYNSVILYQLVIAEGGTYLMASCMATLRPLKRRLLPNYSFTNLVDSGLKKFSIHGGDSYVFGTNTAKRWGLVRTTDSDETGDSREKRKSGESDLERGEVGTVNVVSK